MAPKVNERPAPRAKPAPNWQRTEWQPSDAAALQAIAAGTADAGQQQRALDWIINHAARTYDEPFIPESARETDFLLGRRFVGQQVVKLLKVSLGALARMDNG